MPEAYEFFIDPSRCIGCQSCVQACSECDTHKGQAMIHLEFVNRHYSTQTAPVVCMHCDSPTCAEVCPADAIKKKRPMVWCKRRVNHAVLPATTVCWPARLVCPR